MPGSLSRRSHQPEGARVTDFEMRYAVRVVELVGGDPWSNSLETKFGEYPASSFTSLEARLVQQGRARVPQVPRFVGFPVQLPRMVRVDDELRMLLRGANKRP